MKKFLEEYFVSLKNKIHFINTKEIGKAISILEKTIKTNNFTFCCGNGGSAAISNHFQVDYLKGVNEMTGKKLRIVSLSSNIETITAIANDKGYENVFVDQFKIYSKKNDVLLCISSSGNSKNIIKVLQYAKKNKNITILLSGFDGGQAKKIADINIHIDSNNYGVIEDCHQSIMHSMAQYLSKKDKLFKSF